jgi:hypothetical protein
MSCDEIRYWIRELREHHGWPGRLLARTLGLPDKGALMSKLRRSWIYPGEQIRFSRQLDHIISGELVPQRLRAPSGQMRWEAVVADHPVPLQKAARLAYDLKTGRLRWVQPRMAPDPVLTSFSTAIERFLGAPEDP